MTNFSLILITSCIFALSVTGCSTVMKENHAGNNVDNNEESSNKSNSVSNNSKPIHKKIPFPPIKTGKQLLVDDNYDYLMVIDESTISPKTIKFNDGSQKDVMQAWVYVFYKKPYAPYTLNGEIESYQTNKYLEYFSISDKTSATRAFYLYDENAALINKTVKELQPTDFKSIKPKTIGNRQFDVVKESQKLDK